MVNTRGRKSCADGVLVGEVGSHVCTLAWLTLQSVMFLAVSGKKKMSENEGNVCK